VGRSILKTVRHKKVAGKELSEGEKSVKSRAGTIHSFQLNITKIGFY
jgi:hypothetical protein